MDISLDVLVQMANVASFLLRSCDVQLKYGASMMLVVCYFKFSVYDMGQVDSFEIDIPSIPFN